MARYRYCCVGYGIHLPVGGVYASGRIEVYDNQYQEPYPVNEFHYWIPLQQEAEWRNFWNNLNTDYPLSVGLTGWDEVEKEHSRIESLGSAQK